MLTYQLDQRGTASLYEYLYTCIRADIESGAIAAHEKLPSKRTLAKHLGVSLITIEGAYAQLAAEGYLHSIERKGYFACPLSIGSTPSPPPVWEAPRNDLRAPLARATAQANPHRASENAETPADAASDANAAECPVADFSSGSHAAGLFPYNTWAKTVREALTCESEQTLLNESSAAGSYRLRETLVSYLKGFRGMQVQPEQIIVGAGAQLLYIMIVQLLGRSCRFAVEDPGYPRLTKIYRSNEAALSHVPMDQSGIVVEALRASAADVVHIMPSHQFPTGMVTPISRRYELLGWANEHENRYVVEDDYDCEFRLAGRPIPPLQAIDASERVIYVNTFAKSLGPAFRIGYLVLPPHLAERFAAELGFYSCTVSAIDQLALARFIESGDYERHINRMRSHYRTVQNELACALKASAASDRIAIEAQDSGLHFIMHVDTLADDDALAAAFRKHGVALDPLSGFFQRDFAACAPLERERYEHRFIVNCDGIERSAIFPAAEAIAQAIASV